MPTRHAPFALLSLLLAAGCARTPPPPAPLTHEAYVLEARWSPELSAAAVQGGSVFSGYRVLGAMADSDGSFGWVGVDLAALERSQEPVTAIVRLPGAGLPDADAFAGRLLELGGAWRAAGVRFAGVELDHGSDTAALAPYADWLRRVRAHWPAAWMLSIAESPAWTGAAALPALLAQADASVLRWDRVDAAFDPAALQASIAARAALSPRPFRIALPAYDADAAPAAAPASRGAAAAPYAAVSTLRAAPDQVSALLRTLRDAHPAALAGVAWVQLPVASDEHAWTLSTFHGLLGGESMRAVVTITFDPDANGARDLVLANVGSIDAPVPSTVIVAAFGCDDGSARDGYRLERSGDDWRFVATGASMIRSGTQRNVGHLRCANVLGLKVEENR